MPASTPIARSKSAALARVLDCIPKGYVRYMMGEVPAERAIGLAVKFHRAHGIGMTPAQRLTRKAHGLANCLLVMHWPPDSPVVSWLLLATEGKGLEAETRNLRGIVSDRLSWLGYELVRRAERGAVAWTWRRPKQEMTDLYAMLTQFLNQRHDRAISAAVERIARQPGFHGVREQSKELFDFVRARGYTGELPKLFFMHKVSHGDRLMLTDKPRILSEKVAKLAGALSDDGVVSRT